MEPPLLRARPPAPRPPRAPVRVRPSARLVRAAAVKAWNEVRGRRDAAQGDKETRRGLVRGLRRVPCRGAGCGGCVSATSSVIGHIPFEGSTVLSRPGELARCAVGHGAAHFFFLGDNGFTRKPAHPPLPTRATRGSPRARHADTHRTSAPVRTLARPDHTHPREGREGECDGRRRRKKKATTRHYSLLNKQQGAGCGGLNKRGPHPDAPKKQVHTPAQAPASSSQHAPLRRPRGSVGSPSALLLSTQEPKF